MPNPQPHIVSELQQLQRKRTVAMKGRIAQQNYRRAVVAGTLGYTSALKESERKKLFTEADNLIKKTIAGKADPDYREFILASQEGIAALLHVENKLVKEMEFLAAKLPVASWVQEPNQRGFGLLSLAVVIGEAGDLSNYTNSAKLWRRMGCAPFESDGQMRMGSTWKSGREGRLSAKEWEQFGYSPRRCSIMYVIGENLVKGNHGEYRKRYDTVKAAAEVEHPYWSKLRRHRHAMLLARKRLLRNLWRAWNQGHGCESGSETESPCAVVA